MHDLQHDLHHGFVLLRRDASVSALIVLVLALGIGGNTATFALLKAAFLDPLPYPESQNLVTIVEDLGKTNWNPSVAEFLEIRSRTRTLGQVAFAEHRDMQLTGTEEPVRVFAARVTASFFSLLGTQASLGRTLLEEDNQPRRTSSVVVSDAFWRQRMGTDPNAVGKTLRLDGNPALIVGVLPPGFHFDYPTLGIQEQVDIYVSSPIESVAVLHTTGSGRGEPVRVLARLRQGFTYAQAESELRTIGHALVREFPLEYRGRAGGPSRFTFKTIP
ncbi:MAG: ABC transporter permease, partial [Bryobacteraceae bacterium]|nr:ABC transporter permease [Bryobacteraceae bacterium]